MARLTRDEQNTLVVAARTGDQVAITQLCDFLAPLLSRQLFRMIPTDDIDDVVQETLIKAFRKLDLFAGDSSFSTWVVAIAKNAALMHRRDKRRENEVIVDSIDRTVTNSSGQKRKAIDVGYDDRKAEQNLAYDTVHKAIAQLPERERQVLRFSLAGATGEQLAQLLGLSLANAKSVLLRARKDLASAIEGTYERSCKCGCGTVVSDRGEGYVKGHKKAAELNQEIVAQ
jgi:RNA polymerase sigma-70 factor (ECF subfamily)